MTSTEHTTTTRLYGIFAQQDKGADWHHETSLDNRTDAIDELREYKDGAQLHKVRMIMYHCKDAQDDLAKVNTICKMLTEGYHQPRDTGI